MSVVVVKVTFVGHVITGSDNKQLYCRLSRKKAYCRSVIWQIYNYLLSPEILLCYYNQISPQRLVRVFKKSDSLLNADVLMLNRKR
jgi:hypothetical protein